MAFPVRSPTIPLLKVLAPLKVCVPVVTTPPLIASAGVRVKLPPLMVAPFAVEVPAIAVTLPTEPD